MNEVNKTRTKSNSKKNKKIQSKNVVLILGIIYTLITILAVVSYISKTSSMSTTPVTIGNVMGAVSWQLIMIFLFVVTYLLYTKKTIMGVLLEIVMGMAMLVYIVISVATMGIDLLALIIELIYPLILVFHGLIQFRKINKKKRTKMSTV